MLAHDSIQNISMAAEVMDQEGELSNLILN